jgi:hypothetical protein
LAQNNAMAAHAEPEETPAKHAELQSGRARSRLWRASQAEGVSAD